LEYQLLDTTLFKSVYLLDGNLYWSKLHVEYTFKKKKQTADFSIGADVLYGLSELDNQRTLRIGKLFRTWRTALNLTQEEVARRAGTSRTYYQVRGRQCGCRIENFNPLGASRIKQRIGNTIEVV
jgi:hypothetical protein